MKFNLYDCSCACLIHSYVVLQSVEFCGSYFDDHSSLSELEFVEDNFDDFKNWAESLGYEVEL